VHLLDNSVWQLPLENLSQMLKLYQLPEFCTSLQSNHDFSSIASLKQNNLYLRENRLADNVTSFKFVRNNVLMYTTIDELRFIGTPKADILSTRNIERGSNIVATVPNSSKVILQLPRGNLETIYPRYLSLEMVKNLLDSLEYFKAFEILRKERINLNVLVDHDPALFLANIGKFVEEISNAQWLSLFVSDLQNFDVTSEMYASNYSRKALYPTNYSTQNKINLVCQELINILEHDDRYILTMLTCMVKQGQLDVALKKTWNLKVHEETENCPIQNVNSEEAFKYLLYLVNVNELYNVALGLYDFPLVLFVAKRSQKDPKEYVPFLQELDALEDNYRKFKIDCYLKRFISAVKHISRCDNIEYFQEGLKLITEHKLFAVGLDAYRTHKNQSHYQLVAKVYGDYLREKKTNSLKQQ